MSKEDEASRTARPGRERDLTLLYATARSLTALGELEDVLHSIVRHAHELIGTDFTYLSLLGEGGELCLTESEGTISAGFRDSRIPPGTGLGGKVIDSCAAHWVSNYAEALDIRHDPVFDTLVGHEGMVALLGVPLLVRERAVGVLFVADRRERTFRADEIALLSTFAGHAAVVLDNARLYDESRAALARLRTAYRTIEDQVAVMERAQSVHEALTGVARSGGGPQAVTLQLAEQIGATGTIRDRDRAARTPSRGVDVDALNVVVVADCPTVPNDVIARRLHAIATEQVGLAGEHMSRATMLVPASDPDECVRGVHRRLRRELGQPVTVIGERIRDHDWARAFSRASRCVTIADALGACDVASMTDQFALYEMLLDVDRNLQLERFVAESIGALVEYDRRRSTDLLDTLDVYFDNGGNLRRTAEDLHVHLNTLVKRLDRIAAVLGFDWRAADDLQLRFAVRLQTLRLRLDSPGGHSERHAHPG